MNPVIHRQAADPTPVVVTLWTSHVVATIILFNRNRALGAFVSSYVESPAFVLFLKCLLARLPLVPRNLAAKAKTSIACRALYFLGIL